MLFADEQLTVSATVSGLSFNSYTISGQVADYAYFTITGGDLSVRYDGVNTDSGTLQVLDKDATHPYVLESREQIEGMRFFIKNGSPVIDIQYVMLEWGDLRRITFPKLQINPIRRTKSQTQKIDLGTANFQLRRISDRPLHQFSFSSLVSRGMMGEEDIHGFFYVHQGDVPFYLFANKYSIVEFPTLIGYGDGSTEQFFLPARFIRPFSLKIFLDGHGVEGFYLDEASGLVCFATAIPKNVVITATYTHYYKCVFMGDALEDTLLEKENVLLNRKYKVMEVRP
ncbi:MAG: DUF2460 domain-containing protein [Gammaproteobacteria bacterium]|nr:DUF2460 domain-containing protein [Gammaproteobacteria bacterium]